MNKNNRIRRTNQSRQVPARLLAIIAVAGLLLILGAVFAFSQPSKPKPTIEVIGAPGLKVDREEVDLGDVKLGQTVQVSFQITNVGDQTLRFTREPYIEVLKGC